MDTKSENSTINPKRSSYLCLKQPANLNKKERDETYSLSQSYPKLKLVVTSGKTYGYRVYEIIKCLVNVRV